MFYEIRASKFILIIGSATRSPCLRRLWSYEGDSSSGGHIDIREGGHRYLGENTTFVIAATYSYQIEYREPSLLWARQHKEPSSSRSLLAGPRPQLGILPRYLSGKLYIATNCISSNTWSSLHILLQPRCAYRPPASPPQTLMLPALLQPTSSRACWP